MPISGRAGAEPALEPQEAYPPARPLIGGLCSIAASPQHCASLFKTLGVVSSERIDQLLFELSQNRIKRCCLTRIGEFERLFVV